MMPTVLRLLSVFALVLLLPTRAAHAQHGDVQPFLTSVKSNVVRVVAQSGMGFGFIVGIDNRKLLIATAEHTLEGGDTQPQICFLDQPEPCATGSVIYVDDPVPGQPDLDLALIEVAYPEGLVWRPDVVADAPTAGAPVWFIGRDWDWFIPTEPGRFVGRDPARSLVEYEGLPVARGVSGAPVLTLAGLVAMHVESEGGEGPARGILLSTIRDRVEKRLRWRWILVPRLECDGQDVHRRVLAGRSFVVYFDGARPTVALDAMARLHCLGAKTMPRPVWSSGAWAGDGITYRSGDVRTARTLQAVLAPLGRLDTRLGEPEGEADLWIR